MKPIPRYRVNVNTKERNDKCQSFGFVFGNWHTLCENTARADDRTSVLFSGDIRVRKSSRKFDTNRIPAPYRAHVIMSATAEKILGTERRPNGRTLSTNVCPSHVMPGKCDDHSGALEFVYKHSLGQSLSS